MSGFSVERSDAQADSEVMFVARAEKRAPQVVALAEQVASRVWVMRVMDLEAWKKEFEF
jgi:hypothetical protein